MLGRQFFFFWQNKVEIAPTRLYAVIHPVSGVDANGQFQSSTASAISSGATFKTWQGALDDFDSKGYTNTAVTILQVGQTTATENVVVTQSGNSSEYPLIFDAVSATAGRAFIKGHHGNAFFCSAAAGVKYVTFGGDLELTTDSTLSGSTTGSAEGRYALDIGSDPDNGDIVIKSRLSGAAGLAIASAGQGGVSVQSASIQTSWNDGVQVRKTATGAQGVTISDSLIRVQGDGSVDGMGVHGADCVQIISSADKAVKQVTLENSTFIFNITATSTASVQKQAITFKGDVLTMENCVVKTETLTACAIAYIAMSVRRATNVTIKRNSFLNTYEGLRIVTDASAANSGVAGTIVVDGNLVTQSPNHDNATRYCFVLDEIHNSFPSSETFEVRNNTFYGNGGMNLDSTAAPSWKLRLENNLVVKSSTSPLAASGNSARALRVGANIDIVNDAGYNVYVDLTGEKASGSFLRSSGSDHTTFGSHTASVTYDSTSFYLADARFADPANLDFRASRHPSLDEAGVVQSLSTGGVSVSGSATYISGTALSGSGSIHIGAVGGSFVENRSMTGAGR